MDYDVFALTAPARMTTDPAQSTNAPAGIIPDATTPIAVNVDGRSRWADSIGDYFYAVAASNRYGESQLVPLKATLTTAVLGSSFDLKFADGGGTNPATCYVIYRSQKNPTGTIAQTSLYPIITVGVTEKAAGYDGAAPTLIRDTNKILPGMNQALLYQDDEEVYAFKQLAPIMKMDLAILGPATRFMILMYGTPVLYAPKKVVRFVNVGILP